MRNSKKIIGLVASAALACSMMAAPAFADDYEVGNETKVTFEMQDISQLDIIAPTKMPLAGTADGDLQAPDNMKFTNNSNFDVNITKAQMKTTTTDLVLVAQFAQIQDIVSGGNDKIHLWVNVAPDSPAAGEESINLKAAETEQTIQWLVEHNSDRAITASGNVSKNYEGATAATDVGTIAWKFNKKA